MEKHLFQRFLMDMLNLNAIGTLYCLIELFKLKVRYLINEDHFNGAIVELTEYSASSKKVLVHDFKIIYFLDEIIGNPVNYKEFLSNNLGEGANNRINM